MPPTTTTTGVPVHIGGPQAWEIPGAITLSSLTSKGPLVRCGQAMYVAPKEKAAGGKEDGDAATKKQKDRAELEQMTTKLKDHSKSSSKKSQAKDAGGFVM
jgi:hypothetical protein